MNHRLLAVPLALLALAGCDDDDDITGNDDPVDFMVTVENVSSAGTIPGTDRAEGAVPLSPGAWVVFQGEDPAVGAGGMDDSGTELIAEDGFPSPELSPAGTDALSTETSILGELAGDLQIGTFSSPGGTPDVPALFPGESADFTFTAVQGDKLQLETMFVQSNDWFYAFGNGGLDLFSGGDPVEGEVTSSLVLYDAGTEGDTAPGTGDFQKPVQDPDATDVGLVESVVIQAAASRHPSFTIPATTSVIRVTVTVVQ